MDISSLFAVAAAGLSGAIGSMYLDSRLLLSKDWQQLRAGALTTISLKLWTRQDRLHIYYRFKDRATSTPNRVFVVFEDKEYTYRDIERASNRMAHWLLDAGVKPKDVVCMMHQNHPTFYITMFSIIKIGATAALINTNLANDSLLHCLKITDARILLFDPVFAEQVATVAGTETTEHNISFFAYGETTEESNDVHIEFATSVTPAFLSKYPETDTSEVYLKNISNSDPALLIYTSGTTGMPKAAVSQHARSLFGASMFARITGLRLDDRLYIVLPLYHSSGITVSTLAAILAGSTIVLGRKFSVSRFWDDCVQQKVTAFTYIGEFCRYLLSQPPHPQERKHNVRLIYGNGMRPEIWNMFRERFGIPKICEFYAATEAPIGLFNANTNDFGSGAVGHRGNLFRRLRSELKIIKIDPITEEPLRGPNGFCVSCGYDEQGELIAELNLSDAVQFNGYYKNDQATEKKILHDVFRKGDMFFRSGDLLKLNADGFYFFEDRVGDTFRWKSENVATTEVTRILSTFPSVEEANVYGALVPHHDGRAGMAAVVPKAGQRLDFKKLYDHMRRQLPRYAVPLFIRIVPAMELTATFKHQKVEYRKQGIDLRQIPSDEPVYWLQKNCYIPFTSDDLKRIENGEIKL